jgi:hypothetical protein
VVLDVVADVLRMVEVLERPDLDERHLAAQLPHALVGTYGVPSGSAR